MRCLFVPQKNITPPLIEVAGDDYHHAIKVYRLKIGSEIEIKDHLFAYLCKLKEIKKNHLLFEIITQRELMKEKINITLYQSLLKGERFHYLLQKATELGVMNIIPYIAERSVVKVSTDDNKKIEKWQKICDESCKQCGRDYIPKVHPILSSLNQIKADNINKIIAYENEKETQLKAILNTLDDKKGFHILIGPEGGFTQNEIDIASQKGFLSCSISHHILRSDTAAISVISNIYYHFMSL